MVSGQAQTERRTGRITDPATLDLLDLLELLGKSSPLVIFAAVRTLDPGVVADLVQELRVLGRMRPRAVRESLERAPGGAL